jgi:hypothetical protein
MAWVEQYPFTNPDFEDGDKTQPWVPDSWALASSDSLWKYAAFDDYETGGFENFDGGWGRAEAWPADPVALGWRHKTPDRSDMSSLSVANLSACIATANSVKAIANAHFGDTGYHVVADTRTITSADATDLPSLLALVNELNSDIWLHVDDTTPTWHTFKGYGMDQQVVTPLAVDLPTAQTRLAAIVIGFSRHLWWRGVTYQWTDFEPWPETYGGLYSTKAYLIQIDNFDVADGGAADNAEDFEEKWTSLYLSGAVQAALGFNDDWVDDTSMTPAVHSHGCEFESYEVGWPEWRHKVSDETSWDNQDLSTPTKCNAVANALKTALNAHFPSTTYHIAPDSRTISSPDATDVPTLVTLVNEEYADLLAHSQDASLNWHLHATDGMDEPYSSDYPATSGTTAQMVLSATMLAYARHLWWRGVEHNWSEYSTQSWTDVDYTSGLYAVCAEFDTSTPEEVEDFEEEWSGNENWITSFTHPTNLALASFYGGNPYESFDTARTFASVPTTPGGVSAILDVDRDSPFYFQTTGTWLATYKLQVRRSNGGSWTDYHEFSANTDIEVPAGYMQARIYCVAYTSGSISPTIHWEQLEIY